MCGIVGKLYFNTNRPLEQPVIRKMTAALRHRGPDDEGYFFDERIGLGHRRLSILDISSAGHQPMLNDEKNIWIVFNGEIYNHNELRKELEEEGRYFRSRSDTEVIIKLYEKLGENFLEKLRGMFALAIWDKRQEKLLLARDRLGKKPIKYIVLPHALVFASEIKALLQDPDVKAEPDEMALQQFLNLQYVHGPKTGFQDIKKLPAGHYLVWQDGRLEIKRYWELNFVPDDGPTKEEWQAKIEAMLWEAVRLRMKADVPVGAMLSGGLDSSAVVALMSQINSRPVKTFSVGFEHYQNNELPFARAVAEKYKTDHEELIINLDLIETLPEIVKTYDEPLADTSIVPTWHLAKAIGSQLKVVLNGDGGDECFAGYRRYDDIQNNFWLKLIPGLRQRKMQNLYQYYFKEFLPDNLLYKMDAATMAHSLEARSPFLDHQLVELCAKMPFDLKYQRAEKKYLLKKILAKYLPAEIINREKQGFGLPLSQWFSEETTQKYIRSVLPQPEINPHNPHPLWRQLILELWRRTYFT